MRSKTLNYFDKRAGKLGDLQRRLGLRATVISADDRLLLKLFSSGKLKSGVECATDIHLAFDRRQQDACAEVTMKRTREDEGEKSEQARVSIKSRKTMVG